ncbi:MAG: ergothioneine biosynthesis glutamate--cysteine ligase EgtA [Sciscionella sp.]
MAPVPPTASYGGTAAEPLPCALHDHAAAETYVASVGFKHGPPRLLGVELEWTVHHANDPRRPLTAGHLAGALGPHAPATLDPSGPHLPLANGSMVSVEPGGQVEISTPPLASLHDLLLTTAADAAELADHLERAGLLLGAQATDPHRPPQRLLDTPRYAAMQSAFDRIGPDGRAMMCSTAGLQICLDAGQPDRTAARWAAVHALGPALVALFANSPRLHGRDTTWASTRLPVLFGTDPPRMLPSSLSADPAASWARRALDIPVLCIRRPDRAWDAPPGMTFTDWINGALPDPPTTADLDYHLSTLFPPVRPRGYLEIRYLDAQPGEAWTAPVALLATLMADESTVDEAARLAAPCAGRWLPAARHGLADRPSAEAANALVALGISTMAANTDLDDTHIAGIATQLTRLTGRNGQASSVTASRTGRPRARNRLHHTEQS